MNRLAETLGLEGFRFAHAEWAPLLWAVLALMLFLGWRVRRGSDELRQLIAPALEPLLVQRVSPARRALQIALLGLACTGLVFALMRPQWGARQVAATRAGAELMIALDVSRSMLAEDVAPNRLERAKAEVLDLLSYLDGDQVGLIAFAGRASVLSPLTPDFGFLRLALENAGPHSVTRGGTRLEEPIRRAVAGFGPPGPAQRAILLITDGEDHDSFARDAAEEAAEAGVSIIAIGFGDEAGSPIVVTDPRTGARQPVLDADGVPVQSRLDGEMLRELALLTSGAYIPAGTGVLDLESIYTAHLARLVRGASDRGGRIVRDEGYPWCVLVALLALLGSVLAGARAVAPQAQPVGGTAPRPAPGQRPAAGSGTVAGAASGAVATATTGTAEAAAGTRGMTGSATRTGDGSARGAGRARASGAAVALVLVATSLGVPRGAAWAQVDILASDPAQATAAARDNPTPPGALPGGVPSDAKAGLSARELYNRALRTLGSGDPADAARGFADARRAGPDDPELRFEATYNLGVATVALAEAREAEDAKAALARLREAADWFRQAIEMRPGDADARHNLEIALRKALVLEDMLAKQNQKDLDTELAALAEAQRALASGVGALVHQLADAPDASARASVAETLRGAFRERATTEREIASDAALLADRTSVERAALEAAPEEERTPQDALRSAQLEGVLHYLHRASERLGHTRRELRRQRAESAYRRAAAAIVELERARDQLREPDAVIDAIARELAGLRGRTAALAEARSGLPAGPITDAPIGVDPNASAPTAAPPSGADANAEAPIAGPRTAANPGARPTDASGSEASAHGAERETVDPGATEPGPDAPGEAGADTSVSGPANTPRTQRPARPKLPAWITAAGLSDEQRGLAGRTAELDLRLRAGIENANPQELPPEALAQLEALRQAEPLLERAQLEQSEAGDALESDDARGAVASQTRALRALAEAREFFLKLEGLIELAYGDERRIEEVLAVVAALDDPGESRAALLDAQGRNLKRSERIEQEIEVQLAQLAAQAQAPPDPNTPAPPPEALEEREKQLTAASQLMTQVFAGMDDAQRSLEAAAEDAASITQASAGARRATRALRSLRWLFMTAAERVRALAEEQTQLGDATRDALVLGAEAQSGKGSAAERLAPLLPDQQRLSERTGELADELLEQSQQAEAQAGEPDAGAAPSAGPDADALRLAAEHVLGASGSMQDAQSALAEAPPRGEEGRAAQARAVEALLEALKLLQPPPQDGDQQQDGDQDQQQEQDSQDQGDQEQPEPQEGQNADAARTLQGVLDREAERQRERAERARTQSQPVERDW